MSLNTAHKVTLTEAQISVILNSLDYTLDRWQVNGYQCDEDQKAIETQMPSSKNICVMAKLGKMMTINGYHFLI